LAVVAVLVVDVDDAATHVFVCGEGNSRAFCDFNPLVQWLAMFGPAALTAAVAIAGVRRGSRPLLVLAVLLGLAASALIWRAAWGF
jgi:hypothetical protein